MTNKGTRVSVISMLVQAPCPKAAQARHTALSERPFALKP